MLLGWYHFGAGDVGTDMLDNIAAGPGAIGFVPSLPEGAYSSVHPYMTGKVVVRTARSARY